jgi:hypothetical protein
MQSWHPINYVGYCEHMLLLSRTKPCQNFFLPSLENNQICRPCDLFHIMVDAPDRDASPSVRIKRPSANMSQHHRHGTARFPQLC